MYLRFFKLVGVAAIATAMAGCSHWNFYAVESSFSLSEHKRGNPEVIVTASYLAKIGSVRKIAVRAPDGCADETASKSKGEARSREGVLLKSTCGQEMAILERTLAKASYAVISWKVVESRARTSSQSILDVAKEMDADILLQINSLERLTTGSGADLRWERRFYESNKNLDIKSPVKVPNLIGEQLVSLARDIEGESQMSRSSVSLNVTAAAVDTGEAIWFYEWTLADNYDDIHSETISFSACSSKTDLCKPWYGAANRKDVAEEVEYSSGTSDAESMAAYENSIRATHNALIKSLVSNMVDQFKQGP